MRLFFYTCCIAMVAGIGPSFAQNATAAETTAGDAAAIPASAEPLPSRVGRLSLAAGNVDFRPPGESGWVDGELNQPIFSDTALRTGVKARAEIRVGATTIDLAGDTEISIARLSNKVLQIAVPQGRVALHLRRVAADETVEIDIPQGGIWLLGRGRYAIETGGDKPARATAFDGAAHLVMAGTDAQIGGGQSAVLTGGSDTVLEIEPAAADDFAEWCRGRDYDDAQLAAPYFVARGVTGFEELDAAGVWKIDPDYGPVWFPTQSDDWTPYRFGHWRWIAPWGWSWIDDQPWGFAPSHYGRWALIHDHWAWVPGGIVADPLYAPALVAFLGTPGVGLSSEDGATVAWFQLAPNEAYRPSYTRDTDYIRTLNRGNVKDAETIESQDDGEPRIEVFDTDFANRLYATVVPRSVFVNSRPVAPARMTLPERRLQNAPVLMGSPQIAPPSAQRIARAVAAPNPPVTRVAVNLSHKRGIKLARTASVQSRGHGQPVIIRAGHLRAPSYVGQPRGRQTIVLRVAHSRGGPGKKG